MIAPRTDNIVHITTGTDPTNPTIVMTGRTIIREIPTIIDSLTTTLTGHGKTTTTAPVTTVEREVTLQKIALNQT